MPKYCFKALHFFLTHLQSPFSIFPWGGWLSWLFQSLVCLCKLPSIQLTLPTPTRWQNCRNFAVLVEILLFSSFVGFRAFKIKLSRLAWLHRGQHKVYEPLLTVFTFIYTSLHSFKLIFWLTQWHHLHHRLHLTMPNTGWFYCLSLLTLNTSFVWGFKDSLYIKVRATSEVST